MKNCPVCPDTQLERIRYEGFMIFRCPTCRGALVEDPKVKRVERKMEVPEKALVEEADSESPDSTAVLRCPKCRFPMSKHGASDARLPAFTSDTIDGFHLDYCKYCGLTWFDGGELAKLQLSYERSSKGRDAKQRYVNYADLDEADKAEYGRALAASSLGPSDAITAGFAAGLATMVSRLYYHLY